MEKAPYANCDRCPLNKASCALSTGPENASIAVVSRSPGYNEAMQGKSFSGPSGKVLDHLLLTQNLSRKDVLATNVVLCQTDTLEGELWAATEACNARLESELAEVETIIAAGTEACKVILGDDFKSISSDRGYVHIRQSPISGKDQRVIITNNPAVVIRDDGSYPELTRDFRLAINPLPRPKLPSVRIIDTLEEGKVAAEQMLAEFETRTGSLFEQPFLIASDIEARGTENVKQAGLKHTAEVVCAGFSIRNERAVVFGESCCHSDDFRTNFLRPLYEVPGARYLWHNGKYDIKVLRTNGIQARVDEDTLLLSWALDERPGDPESGAGGHSLEWLLKDELGWPKYEPPSVKHFKKTGKFDYYGQTEAQQNRARKELYEYNGMDTAGGFALYGVLSSRAMADNVFDRPYRTFLIPLSESLTKVELQGNLFDREQAANTLEDEVWPKLRELRQTARAISGDPKLNLNSPQQTGALLYDKWGLRHNLERPKIERKGKRSSDHAVRKEILRGDFTIKEGISRDAVGQFAQTFDDFKSLDKQRGTYFEGLILRVGSDGRIYTDFKIHGTESGRLSSSNPNMQNVTRAKEGMPTIRKAFIPDPGCVFVSADLSQAELRTIAVLSGDQALKSIYLDTDRSLHKEVAAKFYGKDYTYEQYVRAKNINFGVVYWQSAFTFAQMYHMPEREAQDYIDFWWHEFPDVWDWTKSIEKQVFAEGEIQSPFGHKRRQYVIPADQSGRLHVVKEFINFLPQNIAGNGTLYALVTLANAIDWDEAQIRINVHDNLVLNVREEFLDKYARMTKEHLEKAFKESIGWDFPFTADVSYGPNWAELSEYDFA